MFGKFFKKKTEEEKLIDQYDKLIKESYRLSHTDRIQSDIKRGEAEQIWEEVEKLRNTHL